MIRDAKPQFCRKQIPAVMRTSRINDPVSRHTLQTLPGKTFTGLRVPRATMFGVFS
jgi:hypothetical protein